MCCGGNTCQLTADNKTQFVIIIIIIKLLLSYIQMNNIECIYYLLNEWRSQILSNIQNDNNWGHLLKKTKCKNPEDVLLHI